MVGLRLSLDEFAVEGRLEDWRGLACKILIEGELCGLVSLTNENGY